MKYLTLKQIQIKLNVPQHVLIHLCEKGVIEPDVTDTAGRGKWRQFSERNLFEFAVALELRKYQIPLSVIRAILTLLTSFERNARKAKNDFKLPESITSSNPELLLHVYEGETVIIGAGKGLLFGFDLTEVLSSKSGQVKIEKLSKLPAEFKSSLTINLSKIAEQVGAS